MNIIRITANKSGIVRNGKMEGRDWLVVPMVMMVEGVLNGSQGPLLYPADELAKVPAVWNHKPVVVYHPEIAGKGVSACSPEILTAQKIGVIMNTTFKDGKLKAEAWIDPERVGVVDTRVMDAINSKTTMELSTGLFTENEESAGEWNGKPYNAIARTIRPDHLAVLPDQVGACSVADGAGFLRLNSSNLSPEGLSMLERVEERLGLRLNELSNSDVEQQLRALINPKGELNGGWIVDVYDSYFIYSKGEKYWKQAYQIDAAEKAAFSGNPMEVKRVVSFETVTNSGQENTMDKKQKIDAILAANKAMAESDRQWLEGLDDAKLDKLVPVKNEEQEPKAPEAAPKVPATEPVTEPAPTPAQNAAPKTAADFLAQAPVELKEVFNEALQSMAVTKEEMITKITANSRNILTKDQLSTMSLNQLKAIAALAAEPEVAAGRPVNYAGLAPVGNAANGATKEEPLIMPTMNFEAPAAKK